jgi:hypothetical protein
MQIMFKERGDLCLMAGISFCVYSPDQVSIPLLHIFEKQSKIPVLKTQGR